MMTYTVLYKKMGNFFYKKLKKVKGDGFIENEIIPTGNPTLKDIRWFMLEDETRIEIPANVHIFKFSKERWVSINQRMSTEAGQPVTIDKR